MDTLAAWLPSAEEGYLPYYLLIAAVASFGNATQNLKTLHYTRRIYNGRFVPNPALHNDAKAREDSVRKVIPAGSTGKDEGKAQDQVSPLAARLFGIYTIMAGVIRVYAAYRLDDPALYQLSMITFYVAVSHFGSELLVFKTINLGWEHAFPFSAGIVGSIWMTSQYTNYVKS